MEENLENEESSCFRAENALQPLLPSWRIVSGPEIGPESGSSSPPGKGREKVLPGGRVGHCMTSAERKIFVFGGFSDAEVPAPLGAPEEAQSPGETKNEKYYNSMHMLDCENLVWTEEIENRVSEGPAPRRRASMNFHGNSLYVFGGFDANNTVLGDMWEFKIAEKQWEKVRWKDQEFPETSSTVPGPRAEHAAVVYKDELIIFGGYDGKKKLNETFHFNFVTKEWFRPESGQVNAPSRRCKHSAVLYGNKMYILGGFQCAHGINFAQTDLHAYDCEERTWTPILMRGQIPASLQGHRAVVCEDSMYLIGGKTKPKGVDGALSSASELNQDLWRYRFDVNIWSIVPYAGTAPSPRQLHTAVAVPGHDYQWSIYVYGGTDKDKTVKYDFMYALEGLHWPAHAKQESCELCMDLKKLLNKDEFADVVFIVEDSRVYAHKCVLVARSTYFNNMFRIDMKEKHEKEIRIENITREVFLGLLEYIYTDRLDLHRDTCIEVLKAAERFSLDGLRTLCEEKLSRAISVENVAALCATADQINAPNLRSDCIQFIVQNFLEVLDTEGFQEMMSRVERRKLVRDILHQAFCQAIPLESRKRPRENRKKV